MVLLQKFCLKYIITQYLELSICYDLIWFFFLGLFIHSVKEKLNHRERKVSFPNCTMQTDTLAALEEAPNDWTLTDHKLMMTTVFH